jgi:ferrous iron transport protein A
VTEKLKTVAEMAPGESGVIAGFSDQQLSVKLMEMGFLPGTAIQFNFTAPLGDPVCISISGYEISLRLDEAATISVFN